MTIATKMIAMVILPPKPSNHKPMLESPHRRLDRPIIPRARSFRSLYASQSNGASSVGTSWPYMEVCLFFFLIIVIARTTGV